MTPVRQGVTQPQCSSRVWLMGRLLVAAVVAGLTLAASAGLASAGPDSTSACAPGYAPCLPKTGDLNCDEIPDSKKPVRVTGTDPYALDRDRDGLGCELEGNGASTWGLVLRSGKKEAVTTKVGAALRVVGWAPPAGVGQTYELCAKRRIGMRCVTAKRKLTLGVQVLGTWTVARGESSNGSFVLSLRVKRQVRASDSARLV